MINLNYVPCGNYFVYGGFKLSSVEILSIDLSFDGYVKYNVVMDSKSLVFYKDTKFYKSVDAFKSDEEAKTSIITDSDIIRELCCEKANDDKFRGWVVDSRLEEVTFTIKNIKIVGDKIDSISGTDQYNRNIPKKFYRTRQDALNHNIVKVVDREGNVSELVGINVKTRLDEDQYAMADELKALVTKMRDAGMAIVYDDINATISAINTRNIGEIETYCICGEGNWEYELDYEDMTQIVPIDARVDDSYILGVGKKD